MKRVAFAVVAMIAIAGTGSLWAQGIRFGVGGGLVLPVGNYKNTDKLGWLVGGDATYWLMGAPVGIRADLQYGLTSQKSGVPTHTTQIIGGLVEVVYEFGAHADGVRPYVLGGLGLYNAKIDAVTGSESKVGFGGGAGLAFKMGTGRTRLFVEAKYVSVSTSGGATPFLPVRAGFRFGE